MALDLQRILNSASSLRLASALAQTAPPPLGYRVARGIADIFSSRKNAKVVKAVRLNQWVIRGQKPGAAELDAAVREAFRYSARAIFDLYHYAGNPQAVDALISLDEGTRRLMGRREFEARGLVALGVHMSGFDLILQWMCREGLKPLVLTIPDPQGGRRVEYEARREIGMNLVPASVGALRQSIKHLQQGGVVVTGLDRPIPEPPVCPRFFGQPSALPVNHIYLALKAHVPVQIFAVHLQSNGKYHVLSSPPIEMDPGPDRETETLRNAEKVLSIAEGFIRPAPAQWSVPLAVWPDLMSRVPSN